MTVTFTVTAILALWLIKRGWRNVLSKPRHIMFRSYSVAAFFFSVALLIFVGTLYLKSFWIPSFQIWGYLVAAFSINGIAMLGVEAWLGVMSRSDLESYNWKWTNESQQWSKNTYIDPHYSD